MNTEELLTDSVGKGLADSIDTALRDIGLMYEDGSADNAGLLNIPEALLGVERTLDGIDQKLERIAQALERLADR